ncbi:hypothetical protein F3Y22_tig00110419pilonHSYRG00183 [Hibiscus syriacus]|uniref:Uncharacterized protein n=1 Tax=Hibiscus syriacus TaxID=106335 RepID=A0A6A3AQP3_HIBSY|nr:hypothetical protein F3Y22_tig00110419pilonHSYRG00183 [Hibiscus syriacus]
MTTSSDGSSFSASSAWSPLEESYSPPNDSDSTDPVLRYISQMLMEENMEDKPYMFNDIWLSTTPRSRCHSNFSISTDSETSNYVDRSGVNEVGGSVLSSSQAPYSLQPNSERSGSHFSVNSANRLSNIGNGLMESSVSELLVKNLFSDKESMGKKGHRPTVVVKVEKDESESHSDGLIDILYGFQWPILIQHLSKRPGGPPNLRVTGIDIPLRGFRPAERIEETGRRLAKYCQHFGVPFENNPIAVENRETIRIEDIKINSNEMLSVNSLFRFQSLLDETVELDCPRNAVLKLIRKMNPDIFVHNIVNGAYNHYTKTEF